MTGCYDWHLCCWSGCFNGLNFRNLFHLVSMDSSWKFCWWSCHGMGCQQDTCQMENTKDSNKLDYCISYVQNSVNILLAFFSPWYSLSRAKSRFSNMSGFKDPGLRCRSIFAARFQWLNWWEPTRRPDLRAEAMAWEDGHRTTKSKTQKWQRPNGWWAEGFGPF